MEILLVDDLLSEAEWALEKLGGQSIFNNLHTTRRYGIRNKIIE